MNTAQNLDALPLAQLDDAATVFQSVTLHLGGYLTERCGGDQETAQLEIRRALDLPAPVLERRFLAAKRIMEAEGIPSIAEHAAYIAAMINTVSAITAAMGRKQAGHGLQ